MCGIGGLIDLAGEEVNILEKKLTAINKIQKHRGPDGEGIWAHKNRHLGFAHQRLSIIDLDAGHQPMTDYQGNWITYNGEIYNYIEIRQEIGLDEFRTHSDTEVILLAYRKWGQDCVNHLRGMFAFAIWDESTQSLFCARDRFGIKPLYYTVIDNVFYFASEIKSFLPFLNTLETDLEGLQDYLTFQFCLAGKTLFKDISELLPGHTLRVSDGSIEVNRYWEVYYDIDFDHTSKYFEERVQQLIADSVKMHLRSDVPVGAYVSGGIDSGIIASMASQITNYEFKGFTGKFRAGSEYDESPYARVLADWRGFELYDREFTAQDFLDNIHQVIYHLDYPVAGPGSFPQYMVSELASQQRKVVLGGQGGDEIFGGYARYLIAYFEQCIRGAIDGTMNSGNFVVTYESIIPNLTVLKKYKPLLKTFWQDGLFDSLDKRYFRLVNRAADLGDEVNWAELGDYSPYESFRDIFGAQNVQKESYFDSMTHFDFKTLLPALLQVEDRVSMAHGLESRVPFLDHPLVEFAATIPSNIKFESGSMKRILKVSMGHTLPPEILNRKDKMGFPVPLTDWIKSEAKEFVYDTFSSQAAQERGLINNRKVLEGLATEQKFGRKTWGFLCIELWQQIFHDRLPEYRKYLED